MLCRGRRRRKAQLSSRGLHERFPLAIEAIKMGPQRGTSTVGHFPFLNIDLGELPDEAEELHSLAHLANIACGGHAGDPGSMRRALLACRQAGTRASAHPSYPDRPNFGRRSMSLSPGILKEELQRQLRALASVADALGVAVEAVKPHGALYHDADRQQELAKVVVDAAVEALGEGVAIIAPPGGAFAAETSRASVRHLREGFADRGLLADGGLIPRGQLGDLILDPLLAAAQARALALSGRYDTLCVHGDTAGSVEVARAVRLALDRVAVEAWP